jgi:assimilatory nitrate reductase catalytic subunit
VERSGEPQIDAGWIADAFHSPPQTPSTRCSAGKSGECGRIVCSCMSIGERAIGEAIASGCRTVGELGKVLKCGTNCGSCIPAQSAAGRGADTGMRFGLFLELPLGLRERKKR